MVCVGVVGFTPAVNGGILSSKRDRDDRDGIYVEDDGEGIPADEQDTVFEWGHTTTSDGTGFGLAIVAEIAEAHGWDITVCDAEAGGTRFEIELS